MDDDDDFDRPLSPPPSPSSHPAASSLVAVIPPADLEKALLGEDRTARNQAIRNIKSLASRQDEESLPSLRALVPAITVVLRKLTGDSKRCDSAPFTAAESSEVADVIEILSAAARLHVLDQAMEKVFQLATRIAYSVVSDELRDVTIHLMSSICSSIDSSYTGSIDTMCDPIHHQIANESKSTRIKLITLQILEKVHKPYATESPAELAALLALFESSFMDENAQIRSAALESYKYFALWATSDSTVKSLSTLIPLVLKMTVTDEGAEEVFRCLSMLDESILDPHMPAIIERYFEVIENPRRSEKLRATALLMLNNECHRKQSIERIPRIFASCLLMMSELEMNMSTWKNSDVDTVDNIAYRERRNVLTGEDGLRMTATFFHRDLIMRSLLEIVQASLKNVSNDWNRRHAAIMAINAVATSMEQVGRIIPNTTEVVATIIPSLKDPNCRVVAASALALLHLSDHCTPSLHKMYIDTAIPTLLCALGDSRVPRATGEVAATIAHFCKEFPQPIAPHLEAIMGASVGKIEVTYRSLLSEGKTRCLAQVLRVISAAGDKHRVHYYARLIGPLKHCLALPAHHTLLHASTVECVALIASAVGKNVFATDAAEVLRALALNLDAFLLTLGDDFVTNIILVVRAMGEDFVPFLPQFMPLLTTAIQEPTVHLNENGNMNFFPAEGDIRVKKRSACKIVARLAEALGGSFAPFVMEQAELAIAHLTMAIYRTDLEWAAGMCPILLSCSKAHGGREQIDKLWAEFARALKEAIERERSTRQNIETAVSLLRSLDQCLEIIEFLPESERVEMADLMRKESEAREGRRVEREKRKKQFEYRERTMAVLMEEEKMDCELDKWITAVSLALKKYF